MARCEYSRFDTLHTLMTAIFGLFRCRAEATEHLVASKGRLRVEYNLCAMHAEQATTACEHDGWSVTTTAIAEAADDEEYEEARAWAAHR